VVVVVVTPMETLERAELVVVAQEALTTLRQSLALQTSVVVVVALVTPLLERQQMAVAVL
jgi:hypothetical protein